MKNILSFYLLIIIFIVISCKNKTNNIDSNNVQSSKKVYSHFIVSDLISDACYDNTTQTRVEISKGADGQLFAIAKLPTHRMEKVIMGARFILGESDDGTPPKEFFTSPPEKIETTTPQPSFTAGMISPDWFSGAVHIYLCDATIGQYEIKSDSSYPLTFKVVKNTGYVYLCGKGSIRNNKGEITSFGEDSLSYWIERAADSDSLFREGAAQALGFLSKNASIIEKNHVINTLNILLKDSLYQIRRNAIESFVLIDTISDLGLLQNILENDNNKWVKECAKWAIKEINISGYKKH